MKKLLNILGIEIPVKSDMEKTMEWNFMTKLNAVKAIFKKWKKHRLTLYGKNVIIVWEGMGYLIFFQFYVVQMNIFSKNMMQH